MSSTSATDAYRGVGTAVFGASGFIGRWTARALLDAGAHVALVVRRASAIDGRLRAHPRASIVEADLSDEAAVGRTIDATRPAVVFNLAGYGVDRSERDERPALLLNTELPRWIGEAVSRYVPDEWAGQRVVHAGSALEYGEIGGDLAEGSSPNPTTLYGRTKLAGTEALASASAALGVPAVTARLFTVYGAGEHSGRLLPTLLAARAHDDAVPLSEGLQRRDFTYVEDVAEGMLRLGTVGDAGPGAIVNLATGRLTSVRRFVEVAARVLGIAERRLAFGAIPARPEEMQHDPVSTARLQAAVRWVPATPIADGVRRTVDALDADPAPPVDA